MPSQKKKRSHEETVGKPDDTGETRGRAGRVVSRRLNVAQRPRGTSAFAEALSKRYHEEMASLNEAYKEVITSYQIPDRYNDPNNAPTHFLDDVCEYLRQVEEIESRFGNKSADVIAMGSDDSNQLGYLIQDESTEEKKEGYPPMPVRALQNRGVRMVAAGGMHSCAVTKDGEAYTWGSSDNGALGRELSGDEVTAEGTPGRVTGFVTIDGKNEDGQIIKVVAGDSHCLYLSRNGNVYMHGMYKDMDSGIFSDIEEPNGSPEGCRTRPVHVFRLPKKAIDIIAGFRFNAAILEDGSLVTWGKS